MKVHGSSSVVKRCQALLQRKAASVRPADCDRIWVGAHGAATGAEGLSIRDNDPERGEDRRQPAVTTVSSHAKNENRTVVAVTTVRFYMELRSRILVRGRSDGLRDRDCSGGPGL